MIHSVGNGTLMNLLDVFSIRVAKLENVPSFDIQASVPAQNLYRGRVLYTAYLVLKLDSEPHELGRASASIIFAEDEGHIEITRYFSPQQIVFIGKSPNGNEPGKHPEPHGDGWKEINWVIS
ncbi:uncharacterized protein [Coffea arabica]|uniref:Uncharacterized protein n=1 Tax=Coffea arabica TaxID=13443 RepID=A0ABM4UR94_COFAR